MTGGKREGAGRPPTADPARHTVKTRLTDEEYVTWQELGGSKWVRQKIREELLQQFNKSGSILPPYKPLSRGQ